MHEKPLEEQKRELDNIFEDWKAESQQEQVDDVVLNRGPRTRPSFHQPLSFLGSIPNILFTLMPFSYSLNPWDRASERQLRSYSSWGYSL